MDNNLKNEQIIQDTFIPLIDVMTLNNINIEILNKIKFLITRDDIKPNMLQVNISKELFYNIETQEIYQIIKQSSNKYEIIKQNYNQTRNNQKVRRLIKNTRINNAAFTKIGFLIVNILTFALFITTIILLKK